MYKLHFSFYFQNKTIYEEALPEFLEYFPFNSSYWEKYVFLVEEVKDTDQALAMYSINLNCVQFAKSGAEEPIFVQNLAAFYQFRTKALPRLRLLDSVWIFC
jgi:hypothetical protein